MIAPRTGQAPPWLSLAFFFSGFLCLLLGALLLVLRGETVLRYYLLPEGLALAHLIVLGWLTMVMMGALYQLVTVLVSAPLYSVKLGVASFVLYIAGVGGLVESFLLGRTASLPLHGAAAIVAVAIYLLNVALTFRRIQEWTVPARYLAAALTFLGLTVSVGFLYALDLHYHWFPISTNRLAVHAHLGVGGWMTLMLVGVSYRLIPMFTLVRAHDERLAKVNLLLLGGAVTLLVAGLLFDAPAVVLIVPALALAAGLALYAWDARRMFAARLRRRIDLYAWHLFISFAGLALTIVAGLALLAGIGGRLLGDVPATETYAFLALGLWLTVAVMGHCYKIVPMLTWQLRHARRAQAAARPPLLTEMYDHRTAVAALALYTLGAAVTVTGLAADAPAVLRAGASVLLGGVVLFTVNMTLVLVGRPHAAPSTPTTGADASVPGRSGGTR